MESICVLRTISTKQNIPSVKLWPPHEWDIATNGSPWCDDKTVPRVGGPGNPNEFPRNFVLSESPGEPRDPPCHTE
eukprot:1231988-Amorphochlora_amoeboformis.AAC.2